MDKVLKKYCQYEKGLFVFPLPTGIGKTYHVLEYILNNYKINRKIFFITNLKKNLPVSELKSKFKIAGKEKDFEEYVIALDSNSDTIIKTLLNTECPNYITNMPEYKPLKKTVNLIQSYENMEKKDHVINQFIERLKDDIRKIYEPKFRNGIIDWLNNEFKKSSVISESKKTRFIKAKYPWLIELYPQVLSSQKRVFFLSVDKFFLKNTTLIKPSYYFWEDKITEKALIFIDEFDATKSHILNQIIENGFSKKVDLIGLFTHLYSSLSTLKIPNEIIKESDERNKLREIKPNIKQISEIFDAFINKATEINDTFKMTVPFKTVNPDRVRNFLFQDDDFHTILGQEKKYIRLFFSEERMINEIHFQETLTSQKDENLLVLINQLKGFLLYFRRGISYIALNYQQLKKQSKPKDEFPIESALNTTLDLFNLPKKWQQYLIDSILSNDAYFLNKNESVEIKDLNFYMNGFSYYDFYDSDDHDLKSRIYQYQYENTPEKFMLNIANKANVIAISATADSQTVVGNYNLHFLKKRLNKKFRQLEQRELENIKEQFNANTEGYSKVNINVDFISVKNTKKELLNLFNQDEELATFFFNEIEKFGSGTHIFERYIRYFKVFKEFVVNDHIKSFLALGMALPDKEKMTLE